MEIYDPLKEDKEVLRAKDFLPIHYRIILWIVNHLILYSVLLLCIGMSLAYYFKI